VNVDLDSVDSVAAALRKDELVVNTVPHHGLLAERVVLERGGALVNTSALPAVAARSLRAVAGGARGTVLMNAGLAPGVTNLVAADLLRSHPNTDELEIVFTFSASAPRGPASTEFVHRGLTNVPRHGTALIPLPEPFGERRCLAFGEGDAGWIGGIAEGRLVRAYICIAETPVHERVLASNDGGAMHRLPRSSFTWRQRLADVTPGDEPVAHWVAARRGERRLAARTIETRGDFLRAALSTVVFAEALLDHRDSGGCFDPEEICTLADVEPRLATAGIRVVPQRERGPLIEAS
jgi:hypothetical protein